MAQTEEEKKEWKELIERQEKSNIERERFNAIDAEKESKKLLSGQTQAGEEKEVKKEETPAEYAKRVSLGKI